MCCCTARRPSIRARRSSILGQHAEVIAPSHPGFGRSPRPDDFDTIYDLVRLYLDVLEALPYEAVTLLGFSFGGWLAAEIAATCSRHVRGLILVDGRGNQGGWRERRTSSTFFNTLPQESTGGAGTTREVGHRPRRADDDELVVRARNWDALCLYAWHPVHAQPPLATLAEADQVPTLVLWGRSDRVVSPDYGRAYAASIPGARFELIKAAASPGDRAARGVREPRRGVHGGLTMQAGTCARTLSVRGRGRPGRRRLGAREPADKYCEPRWPAQLFQECLDEYLLCDDVGSTSSRNEHHSGINCLYGASPLILGILARQTRHVRLLSLGTLDHVRPIRCAPPRSTDGRRDLARPASISDS